MSIPIEIDWKVYWIKDIKIDILYNNVLIEFEHLKSYLHLANFKAHAFRVIKWISQMRNHIKKIVE